MFYQILVKIRGEAKYLYRHCECFKICTVNVLNCLKNDRSSKFIVYVVIVYTLCMSRKSKLKSVPDYQRRIRGIAPGPRFPSLVKATSLTSVLTATNICNVVYWNIFTAHTCIFIIKYSNHTAYDHDHL